MKSIFENLVKAVEQKHNPFQTIPPNLTLEVILDLCHLVKEPLSIPIQRKLLKGFSTWIRFVVYAERPKQFPAKKRKVPSGKSSIGTITNVSSKLSQDEVTELVLALLAENPLIIYVASALDYVKPLVLPNTIIPELLRLEATSDIVFILESWHGSAVDTLDILVRMVELDDLQSVLALTTSSDIQTAFCARLEHLCNLQLIELHAQLSVECNDPQVLMQLPQFPKLLKHSQKLLAKFNLLLASFPAIEAASNLIAANWLAGDMIRLEAETNAEEAIQPGGCLDLSFEMMADLFNNTQQTHRDLFGKWMIIRFLGCPVLAAKAATHFSVSEYFNQHKQRQDNSNLVNSEVSVQNAPSKSVFTFNCAIYFVDSTDGLSQLRDAMPDESSIISLDCEWKPDFLLQGEIVPPSVMQFGILNRDGEFSAFVVGVPEVAKLGLQTLLVDLFNSKSTKLGFEFSNDLDRLKQLYKELPRVHNLVDLAHHSTVKKAVESRLGRAKNYSLNDLALALLNVSLDKSFRVTNWDRRPLAAGQLSYAANDVLVLLRLFQVLDLDIK